MVDFWQFNNLCIDNSTDNFIAGLLLHEGFGSNGDNGHESVARQAARDLDLYALAEGRTERDSTILHAEVFVETSLRQQTINGAFICESCVGGNVDELVWELFFLPNDHSGYFEVLESDTP